MANDNNVVEEISEQETVEVVDTQDVVEVEVPQVNGNNKGPEIEPVEVKVLQSSSIPMELKFGDKTYDIRQDVHAGHTDKLHKLYLLLIYFTLPNLQTIIDVEFYIKSNGLDEILIERQLVTEEKHPGVTLEEPATK